jgi:OmcA/MtrC family decaheme c-type cytochrome
VDAGVFTWRSAVPLSPSDQGSFTVGVEACVTNDGGVWCAPNAVAPFGVTDVTPVARRQSVSVTQCNACHRTLTKHGVAANDTSQCVLCHHANAVEPVVVPASGPAVTAVSLDFKGLIHRLHAAAQYPSPQANCSKCHVGTGGTLPIAPAVLPSRDDTLSCSMAPADGGTVCDAASVLTNSSFTPPASTACLGCHGSLAAQAHAIINTTSTGAEACAVCHQAGRTAGLDLVHALAP